MFNGRACFASRLCLIPLLFLWPTVHGHSFLVCTNLREDLPGKECVPEISFPFHENIPKGSNLDYDHDSKGQLCKGRSDGFGMKQANSLPNFKAGTSTILARVRIHWVRNVPYTL